MESLGESSLECSYLLPKPGDDTDFSPSTELTIPIASRTNDRSVHQERDLWSDEFWLNRRERVTLRLTDERLEWTRAGGSISHLALREIVAVSADEVSGGCCSGHVMHKLCVHSFLRCKKGSPVWKPVQFKFTSQNTTTVRQLVHHLQSLLEQFTERPKKLWVFINPYGGARRAVKIWKSKVAPLFQLAGIAATVQITQKANEAFESVRSLASVKLDGLDGIVVVGGDGLFQEVMNGLLQRPEGSERQLRIGHVPAGSTDAVAWSVNGSRCPVSAALRIILGDRMSLDVMNVQSDVEHYGKYSACVAAYGFMGDIISISEKLRWCGPARYDIAGVLTFITHKAHKARISYVSAQELDKPRLECKAPCQWCKNKQKTDSASVESSGMAESNLQVVEDEFVSIMITVTPCRSDKSPNGLIPHAHLSDGRIHLTLVKKCPRWRYLTFLISLAKHGVIPGEHDFVQTIDARWARVEPVKGKSTWSIDGELLRDQIVTSTVHHGLVEVFARGIEIQE